MSRAGWIALLAIACVGGTSLVPAAAESLSDKRARIAELRDCLAKAESHFVWKATRDELEALQRGCFDVPPPPPPLSERIEQANSNAGDALERGERSELEDRLAELEELRDEIKTEVDAGVDGLAAEVGGQVGVPMLEGLGPEAALEEALRRGDRIRDIYKDTRSIESLTRVIKEIENGNFGDPKVTVTVERKGKGFVLDRNDNNWAQLYLEELKNRLKEWLKIEAAIAKLKYKISTLSANPQKRARQRQRRQKNALAPWPQGNDAYASRLAATPRQPGAPRQPTPTARPRAGANTPPLPRSAMVRPSPILRAAVPRPRGVVVTRPAVPVVVRPTVPAQVTPRLASVPRVPVQVAPRIPPTPRLQVRVRPNVEVRPAAPVAPPAISATPRLAVKVVAPRG